MSSSVSPVNTSDDTSETTTPQNAHFVQNRKLTTASIRLILWHVLTLFVARIACIWVARAYGFFALSDDDFSRIVISQRFSTDPRLDPSGSSWLPMPFWITGLVMRVVASTIEVAQMTSWVVACGCGVLLYGCARFSGVQARASWLGALVWTLMPVSIFTGAASVPELPTATLCACAILMLRRITTKKAIFASILLFLATLCRYEAWFVAACVTIPIGIVGYKRRTTKGGWMWLAAIAIATAGPLSWLVWNHVTYGNALHFHHRVASYWFALRQPDEWKFALPSYPISLVMDAPEWTIAMLGAGGVGVYRWRRDVSRSSKSNEKCHKVSHPLSSWTASLVVCAAVVLALSIAQLTGGAPTHHPERTLMFIWAVGWVICMDVLLQKPAYSMHISIQTKHHWRLVAAGLIVTTIATSQVVRTQRMAPTYGVDRTDELQLGKWLRTNTNEPVLMAATDFGYFAVQAAMYQGTNQSPLHVVCTPDPRVATVECPFDTSNSLQILLKNTNAAWLVAKENQMNTALQLGTVQYQQGAWKIVQVRN